MNLLPFAGIGVFFFIFVFIALLNVALIGVWIWMIVECATRETDDQNQRLIWILVVVLAGWIGALVYLFARRPQRIRELGQ